MVIVVLFALGIGRAWEFAGADKPSLVGAAFAGARDRGATTGPGEDGSGSGRASSRR